VRYLDIKTNPSSGKAGLTSKVVAPGGKMGGDARSPTRGHNEETTMASQDSFGAKTTLGG